MNFNNFTIKSQQAIQKAQEIASGHQHQAIESIHILKGIISVDENLIPFIFNKEARSLLRNTLSYIYRLIVNTTFIVNFNYTNGTVLYRKSVLKELDYRSNGFFFQTDILIRTVKKGYLFAEVPYRLGQRAKGVSKAITFPSLRQVVKGYLRLIKDHYFSKSKRAKHNYADDSLTAVRRNKDNI